MHCFGMAAEWDFDKGEGELGTKLVYISVYWGFVVIHMWENCLDGTRGLLRWLRLAAFYFPLFFFFI